jgi:signal transduction histidine kinase
MATTASDSSRLQFLVEAGITIASGLDLDRMLERIVELACRLTDARYGALGVIDPSGRRLERFITHGIDADTHRAIGPEPTGKGILGVLITDARPLRLADISADPRSVGFPDHHPPMGTFLGVPVKAGDAVFGNLYLTEKTDGEFTAIDEQLVTMLAAQAGVAIENARLFADSKKHASTLERAVTQLAGVAEINDAILSGRPIERVLELVAEQLRQSIGCRLVSVSLVDAASGTVRVQAAAGDGATEIRGVDVPLSKSKAGIVLAARRTVMVHDLVADPQVNRAIVDKTGVRSGLYCPLVYRDQGVGVLVAYDPLEHDLFDDDDVHITELFTARATLALGMSRALESERERSKAEQSLVTAEQRHESQREILRRVVETQEAERRRIARELHDDTGQALASVLIGLRRAEELEDPAEMRQVLADLRETIAASVRDLRALAVELRPTALDDFGLGAALERLADTFGRRTGLAIDLHVAGIEHRLPEATETALYRIVQESLNNVAKHAGAGRASVVLQGLGDRAVLVIEDDGRGFDPGGPSPGLGLVSMRERAELVGGTIRVDSRDGGGTTVAVEVPA